MNPRFWSKIYDRTHGPSFREYVEIDVRDNPIKLLPRQTRAIYIQSTLPGDEVSSMRKTRTLHELQAIVYDNRYRMTMP